MSVAVALRLVEVTNSSRNLVPTASPEGFNAQSDGTV